MSTSSVFTYGTLQIPEVMQAVTGRNLKSVPARLNGFQRLKIKRKTYPALIENRESHVDGELYRNIDDETMVLLDEFEDVCYSRILVDVVSDCKMEKAFVYLWRDEYRNELLDDDWSPEEFKRKYLRLYINRIQEL